MEVVDGTHKASQSAPEEDYISSMPDIVITNIMDRLPIQEAVRTGILSKDWRYKWTTLTQLVFDIDFCEFLRSKANDRFYGRIVSKFLLHLKGSIKKFVLFIRDYRYDIMEEYIHNWVFFLSKKGLKELTLIYMNAQPLTITSHVFSCLELTQLVLKNCKLDPASDFQGFPNLRSLALSNVLFASYRCGEFLTRCPNLETLILFSITAYEINEDEIARLVNLRKLYLQMSKLENTTMITSSRIFRVMGFLTKLRELDIDFSNCELLADAKTSVPNALPCLMKLRLWHIDFSSKSKVSFAVELISGAPNLHTLKIKDVCEDGVLLPAPGSSEVDWSRMSQLKLQKVVLSYISGLENEECLIKWLLACSSLLKKMVIRAKLPQAFANNNKERDFATKLLKLHRASPIAEIDIVWY